MHAIIEVVSLLGKRIKALRMERGMTQQQLGELINVTKVSICGYEKGTRNPTLQTLTDLAQVFGVDINYFLGLDTTVVAEDSEPYQVAMSHEEVVFIMELRKNARIYEMLIENPIRLLQLIDKKIK